MRKVVISEAAVSTIMALTEKVINDEGGFFPSGYITLTDAKIIFTHANGEESLEIESDEWWIDKE